MDDLQRESDKHQGKSDAGLIHKGPNSGIYALPPFAGVVLIPFDDVGLYGARENPQADIEEAGKEHDNRDGMYRFSRK